ncbi:Soma ferritin [Nymphon striatum]|nr:Soma ferritin [Nymphon striatum]
MVEELRTASSKVGLEINLIETMASRPRQNFHQESEACINKQINMELYASYVYMSMSYYFDRDDVALKGFAKYFKKASDEEREHAEKFMKYQNKRGGRIALQDVKKPAKDSWDSPIEATKAALALEKEVNQALLNMHKVSDSHGDAQHAKRVSWRAFCSQVSRTNPFSDAYKLCRSEFRRKHLDEPLLDSNGHRYADVAEECKALMNYHLGDEDGIQPETIVTPEGNALNDKVDLLAKQAVSINYSKTFSRVPIDFIKSQIGIEARKEYHQWYSSLDNNLRIKTLFPKLRDLTNFIGSYEIGFIESQVITGHGHLKEYLHRRHVTVDPYCECDSVSIQNADHLLFACSTYRSISSPLINKLNRYKIPLAVQQVIKTKLAGLLFKTFRKIYEEMLQLQS